MQITERKNRVTHNKMIHLVADSVFIFVSVIFAVYITRSGLAHTFISYFSDVPFLESFVSGLFFTSVFTTAPAIALLAEIAGHQNIFIASFFGALGAVISDLVLLKFVEDRFKQDLMFLIGKNMRNKFSHIFKRRLFRGLSIFIGILIIASPFPDELGISIIGIAKTRKMYFILFSLLANFAGIFAIMSIASSL